MQMPIWQPRKHRLSLLSYSATLFLVWMCGSFGPATYQLGFWMAGVCDNIINAKSPMNKETRKRRQLSRLVLIESIGHSLFWP
jgi:hypothetical protein